MLENKVAIVTGASRGIGRAIALKLAELKATVIVNYCGSKDKAQAVAEEILAAGGNAVVYQGNVADAKQMEEMFASVLQQFGHIDILVNNAGVTKDNLILKMSEQEFDTVIDTDLKGVYNCLKQVSKIMLKQKAGRIVNVSSVVGLSGNAGQINYCAAKAGVLGLTKSLARELGSRGITVNAIAPGFIDTDMTAGLSDKVKEGILTQIPLRRIGKAEEVAELVAFLCSDNASYITGQTISIDGGMHM